MCAFFFFSSRRRHTRSLRDWSSDVCSSDLAPPKANAAVAPEHRSADPAGSFTMAPGHNTFVPPPITILTGEASQAIPLDREGLTATADKLRQKLASFGIQGQVTQIRPGPVV